MARQVATCCVVFPTVGTRVLRLVCNTIVNIQNWRKLRVGPSFSTSYIAVTWSKFCHFILIARQVEPCCGDEALTNTTAFNTTTTTSTHFQLPVSASVLFLVRPSAIGSLVAGVAGLGELLRSWYSRLGCPAPAPYPAPAPSPGSEIGGVRGTW